MKALSMNLLTMIVIFVAVLALSIVLFNPGGVIERFKEMLDKLKGEDFQSVDLSSGNKALHVYLNVTDISKPSILEFHLFNSLTHDIIKNKEKGIRIRLSLNSWKKDKCTLLITERTLGRVGMDSAGGGARVYYLDTGLIIQDNSNIIKLYDVVRNSEGKCKCINDAKEGIGEDTFIPINLKCKAGLLSTIDTGVCDSIDVSLRISFGQTVADNCKEFSNIGSACPKDGCCHLLYKTDVGNHIYKIKYGIICGYKENSDEAYWWACTKENDGEKVNAGGKTYVCKFEEGIGKWSEG